ncbi:hypothetical protein [Vreelandella rituensis]|uniref:antitoxin PaaA2 family protein n=1 Tax=Vreelandella rituensis TaxID=2282306 RepID=UPI0039EFEB32
MEESLYESPLPPSEVQEKAGSYDRWFRDRVQRSLDDPHPGIPPRRSDRGNGRAH